MREKKDVLEHSAPARLAIAISQSPRECVGFVTIMSVTSTIIINALFLQPRPHPAPIFAFRPAFSESIRPAPSGLTAVDPKTDKTRIASQTKDPIAALIESPKRVTAVQRALAELGYGQLKLTGTYNAETQGAIEKFERDRHLPVTGQISDRLMRELAAMSGRAVE